MKKLLLTLTLAASVAAPLTINAQDAKPERPKREGGPGGPGGQGGGERGPRMSPEERMKKLTEALSLTQEQQDKVKAIFESGREEMGKLREAPESERRQKFGEFMKAQNEKIEAVLTPEQKDKYQKIVAERMKQMGERRGGGPGGEGGKKPEGGDKK